MDRLRGVLGVLLSAALTAGSAFSVGLGMDMGIQEARAHTCCPLSSKAPENKKSGAKTCCLFAPAMLSANLIAPAPDFQLVAHLPFITDSRGSLEVIGLALGRAPPASRTGVSVPSTRAPPRA